MHQRFRSPRLFAALLMLATIIGATAATAQPTITNPPCINVTVMNNSLCPATVTFTTIPAGVWPTVTIPANTSMNLPVPPPGVTVTGITSMGGFFYGFNPPAPPFTVNCGPTMWWIHNVTLGPPPGCCFDICVDPVNCTIWLNRTLTIVPPPCNP